VLPIILRTGAHREVRVSDRYIAEVLDDACRDWLDRVRRGESPPTHIGVNPVVYEVIAEAQASDLRRGNPMLLLGLDVVQVDGLPPARAELRHQAGT
jgi:hypothetical protein